LTLGLALTAKSRLPDNWKKAVDQQGCTSPLGQHHPASDLTELRIYP
jgi:hypothetical protein